MNHLNKFVIVFLFIINGLFGKAQFQAYVVCSDKSFRLIDISNCTSQLIGFTQWSMYDIARNPVTNEIFVISGSDQLFKINTATATLAFIGNVPVHTVALCFSPQGIMYGVANAGEIYQINPNTANAWLLGNTGTGYYAAGDIAYYDGYLYYSGIYGTPFPGGVSGIIRVDPNNISNSEVITINSFFSSTYGLCALGCEPTLYGFTPGFTGGNIFKFPDVEFEQFINVCPSIVPTNIYGATSVTDPPFYGEFGFDEDTTKLCDISDSLFNVGIDGATYLWHDGSTDSTYLATQEETIWVEATWNSCFYQDTTTITFGQNPVVFLGNDTSLCAGEEILLDASYPNSSYYWQDGNMTPDFNVSQEGQYWVDVTYTNCTVRDSIFVGYDLFVIDNLPPDQDVCFDETLVLDVTSEGATYLWQDGSGNPTYTVNSPGDYFVEVYSGNCEWSDAIHVDFVDCRVIIDMPNVFTPNGDNNNELFTPLYVNGIEQALYTISNRWGQVIFETSDPSKGWDGSYAGEPCPDGVYFYSIRFTDVFGKNNQKSGFFHLIRD